MFEENQNKSYDDKGNEIFTPRNVLVPGPNFMIRAITDDDGTNLYSVNDIFTHFQSGGSRYTPSTARKFIPRNRRIYRFIKVQHMNGTIGRQFISLRNLLSIMRNHNFHRNFADEIIAALRKDDATHGMNAEILAKPQDSLEYRQPQLEDDSEIRSLINSFVTRIERIINRRVADQKPKQRHHTVKARKASKATRKTAFIPLPQAIRETGFSRGMFMNLIHRNLIKSIHGDKKGSRIYVSRASLEQFTGGLK